MADVLEEYGATVFASDVHDYGYGDFTADFLGVEQPNWPNPEWIITNPPFGDKGEQFVIRALNRASVGVAMFVRMQWLETTGRYENIFRHQPPTLISFFAEARESLQRAMGARRIDGDGLRLAGLAAGREAACAILDSAGLPHRTQQAGRCRTIHSTSGLEAIAASRRMNLNP
jgi:hypothetical protein